MMEYNADDDSVGDGSPIDMHGKLAVLELAVSMIVVAMYYVLSKMGVMAASLWKSVLLAQIFVSIVIYFHYVMNRRSRRLWVEGVVSVLALAPWAMIAFAWLFYISSIPMSGNLKVSVIIVCFLIIGWHSFMVLSDFRRAARKDAVVNTIYYDDGSNLIFRNSLIGYIDKLTSRNPLKGSLLSGVGYLMPLAAAFGMSVNHIFGENIGPHVACVVLSVLGFPMSVWLVGNACVRSIFFRVYLPLKLEKKTGKKVLLVA
ncbi:hypothetical protein [Burkholderia stabilis]|nr:hypothetical protein [Burkholderia stabilis]